VVSSINPPREEEVSWSNGGCAPLVKKTRSGFFFWWLSCAAVLHVRKEINAVAKGVCKREGVMNASMLKVGQDAKHEVPSRVD
jgi:hypothetical protein